MIWLKKKKKSCLEWTLKEQLDSCHMNFNIVILCSVTKTMFPWLDYPHKNQSVSARVKPGLSFSAYINGLCLEVSKVLLCYFCFATDWTSTSWKQIQMRVLLSVRAKVFVFYSRCNDDLKVVFEWWFVIFLKLSETSHSNNCALRKEAEINRGFRMHLKLFISDYNDNNYKCVGLHLLI